MNTYHLWFRDCIVNSTIIVSRVTLYVRLVVTPFNSDEGRWTDNNETLYPRTTQANTQRLPRKWPQFTSIRQNAWYC